MTDLERVILSALLMFLPAMSAVAGLIALDWRGSARRLWGPVQKEADRAPPLLAYRALTAVTALAAALGALVIGALLLSP